MDGWSSKQAGTSHCFAQKFRLIHLEIGSTTGQQRTEDTLAWEKGHLEGNGITFAQCGAKGFLRLLSVKQALYQEYFRVEVFPDDVWNVVDGVGRRSTREKD